MVRVNSKVGGLPKGSTAGCVCVCGEKGFQYSTQSLQSPNSVSFCSLALFLPFPLIVRRLSPLAHGLIGGLGQNRKTHLVPLIAITEYDKLSRW